MASDIAVNMTAQGPVPTDPGVLLATLIALATARDPGLTANLPGSLISDVAETDVGALAVVDSAVVDYINSLSPRLANAFLLNQLGQIYGVRAGQTTNTSVFVAASGSSPGFVIPRGFVVSDGTHQYIIQDGGVVKADGTSDPLFAYATQSGIWPVPANTVNQLATSVPSTVVLNLNNPTAGTPQGEAQTEGDYRAQVLQAGLAVAQGVPAFLKTQLEKVAGVQPRLISVRNPATGQWEIICGGGDPYDIADAIFSGILDLSTLVGSTLGVTGITNANPGVATTNLNHGFANGQVINIAGVVGMSGVNNTPLTVTVITEKTFSIGINTTGSGAYVSGGVVTPNLRNVSVSINDFPDTYSIPFVNPPQQSVTVSLTWNTTSPNFISPTAIAQLAIPAIVDYINSIQVGAPINIFELDSVFQLAVASLLPTPLLSRIVWAVSINGVSTAPTSGTGLIVGDPESYFFTQSTSIAVAQG